MSGKKITVKKMMHNNLEILFVQTNLHRKGGGNAIKLIKLAPAMIQVKGLMVNCMNNSHSPKSH